MSAADQGQVIARLKAEITDLKASCQKLTTCSKAFGATQKLIDKLEREVQLARRQYDQVLADRRKLAAELEQLFTQFQELQAPGCSDNSAQQQTRQLQTQIDSTASQMTEALAAQKAYQDVIQQLKEGHEQFGGSLEELKQQLQKQQGVLRQRLADLLQAQHSRDSAKRDLHTAEQQLGAGRASRTGQLQQLAQQCQCLLKQQLQAQESGQVQWSSLLQGYGQHDSSDAVQVEKQTKCSMAVSPAQCIEGLLVATRCSDASQLQLHVQALLEASSGMEEKTEALERKYST